ncbi:NAD(P)/FAD-dependent oxidoreductase [Nocardioides dongxiaopingii]|uniref:NAD(P)/FAD-dependent oxidoreductase n=1 Tax=Nocardioides dongxiaopingii TaxID=2576036 RepID=UPI0010C761E6|nr:NAD(P)/FAD-dependent oxidoreductase [Nocardioides dongxiaopingii]
MTGAPDVDLVVAGGGPAGLATALHAVRAGLSVRVVEPRPAVIDKACGEGLMPGALAALAGLGVDPSGHPLHGIAYRAGGRWAAADFAAGPGRGVRRTVLHAGLRDAVDRAGVEVVADRVRSVAQDADGVRVRLAGGEALRARYLVAADGLHSPLRRSLGLDVTARRRARYGLRQHHALAPWTSHVEVHWAADAEVYVTPVAGDLVGVAVLSSSRRTYDEHLAAFPAVRERLAATTPANDVRGAGPLRQEARRRVAGRVLLVGDAAGYVDALTGEGVSLALGQAAAVVTAIGADDPQSYEQAWTSLTRRYRWLTGGLVAATALRPVRRAVVPAASALPSVFSLAVNALARPVGG